MGDMRCDSSSLLQREPNHDLLLKQKQLSQREWNFPSQRTNPSCSPLSPPPPWPSWLSKDSSEDLAHSFGEALAKDKSELDRTLRNSIGEVAARTIHSMMITICTAYHMLINIGFLQFRVLPAGNVCCISYFYVFRAFRRKDYEYLALRNAVEFALRDLRCGRCFIWIHQDNYLFLAIAKTANFRLPPTRHGTASLEVAKTSPDALHAFKYCFMISSDEPTFV